MEDAFVDDGVMTESGPFSGKHNRKSMADLISWLETLDPNEEYPFSGTHGTCVLSRFARERLGYPDAHFGGVNYSLFKDHSITPIPMALREVARDYPHTFGGALDRARKELEHA